MPRLKMDRSIQFAVNDGLNISDPAISTVTVTRTNDLPAILNYYTDAGLNPNPIAMTQSGMLTFEIDSPPAPSASVYLEVADPDSNPDDFMLIVLAGDNYFLAGTAITPMQDFSGSLMVPVMIYDGTDYSALTYFNVQVDDITNPTVSAVEVHSSGMIVDVTFTEPMDAGVTTAGNYTLSGDGQGTLTDNPHTVALFVGNTYRLAWNSGEMMDGGDVTVTVSGVEDDADPGLPIGTPNSATDIGGGIGVSPETGINNAGGTYTSSVTVTLECTDVGSGCASTYYATDGGVFALYTEPFDITADTTLEFYSVDNAGNQEAVQAEIYEINIPTTISCDLPNLDPDEITFGESFTITGDIDPLPINPNQGISITLHHASSGTTVPLATSCDGTGNFSLDVACHAITEQGTWTVQSSWGGDASHLGDSSDPITLTVNQAPATLSLGVVMSEAVKINSRPPIGGNFSPVPYCNTMDLTGTPIIIHATEPDGGPTYDLVAYTNQYGQFLMNYDTALGGGAFAFDALGEWEIWAEYEATDNIADADTDKVTIRVIPTAGYAIVIQGRVASGEGMPSHHKTATFVYDKLKDRQLLDDDIQYLSWLYHDGWDGDPSRTKIQQAITEWARDKMDPSYHPPTGPDEDGQAGDLYIIMVDHGWTDPLDEEEGVFFIHPDDPITSTELAGWIDDLQNNLTGEAADRNIVVILGFCRAGAFVDDLAGPNRVVIASADKHESSHRGPQDVDADGQPLRDGEYFVSEFFKSVSYGKSIKHSFEEATVLTEAFTSTGSGVTNAPYYDDSVQHPILDDTGDGVGSNELSIDEGEDGSDSALLFIGASPPQGNDPGDVLVTRVAQAQFIEPGATPGTVDLWAEADNPTDVRLIWLEVKAPNYDPIDPGEGFQIEMETFKKATTDVTGTRYLWNAVGDTPDPADLFDAPGAYQIFYFVKDDVTGHTSPLMQGRVYRKVDGNNPPQAFDLIYPENCFDIGCAQKTTLALDWQDALNQAPENDKITYTVLLSKDDPTFEDPIYIEGLPYSGCVLGPEHGIEDLSTYSWKVQAIDEYGALRESTSSRVFRTDNGNLGFGWIEGHVYSAYDDTPIVGATVSIAGIDILTGTGGYYLGILTPSTYVANISADGFLPRTIPGVGILEGGLVTREFWLALDDQVSEPTFSPGQGTFTTITGVTISCDTQSESLEIRYTLDGNDPVETSLLYDGPISITETTTIKARAYLTELAPSNVAVGVYTIDLADGDLSGEGEVNLADAIIVLKALTGIEPATVFYLSADVNEDGKIGMEEFIFILQKVANLR